MENRKQGKKRANENTKKRIAVRNLIVMPAWNITVAVETVITLIAKVSSPFHPIDNLKPPGIY